jgi:PD-(D/E)XK nuclease superfamily protein
MPPGDPIKVSATTYLSFRQCPAQAEARLQGVFSAESKASFTGALAHRLFARHLTTGPIEDVNQAIREEIGAALNGKMAAIGVHRPSELTEMIREASALYGRFRNFPAEGFEAAEISLDAEASDGVRLIGKIDAVFRDGHPGPILRDWKTGGLGEPFEQLLFYALAWVLERDEMVAAVEAVSLQTGERMRRTPSVAELTIVAAHIADLVTQVRTSWSSDPETSDPETSNPETGVRTERRAGPWCRYCPILADCPEGRSAEAINR